jgi:2-oxo-3-hexenedioate decarboxylase
MSVTDDRIVAGMASQAHSREDLLAAGAVRAGWKAGFGTRAAMAKLGLGAPLAGFLTDATRVVDGGTFSINELTDPQLEAEVALRLGGSIAPTATPDEILAAINAVAPAIEIIDMGPPEDLKELLAGNIFHRAYAVGPFVEATPATFDATWVSIYVDGSAVAADLTPAGVLGQVQDILSGMARQLPLARASFEAGDIVITGSVIPALKLAGGETVRVSLATGQDVSINIGRTP